MGFVFFAALVIFLVIGSVSYAFYVNEKKKEQIDIPAPIVENPIIIEPIKESTPAVDTVKLIEDLGLLTQEDVNKLKKTKPVRKKSAPKKTSRKRK